MDLDTISHLVFEGKVKDDLTVLIPVVIQAKASLAAHCYNFDRRRLLTLLASEHIAGHGSISVRVDSEAKAF